MMQIFRRLAAMTGSMWMTLHALPIVAQETKAANAPLPRANPESVGMSTGRLANLGEFFRREVQANSAAGYAVLVARHGKLVYATVAGMQDRENAIPMSLDTRFRIFSMSMPVTSVAVLMLYEEGKLQLDDPLARYLPEFADTLVFKGVDAAGNIETEPQRQPITVRHLLTHTSGLGYAMNYDRSSPLAKSWGTFNPYSGQSMAESIRQLAKLPLYFQPGSDWRYSYATDVLGHLVSVVSGMPFEQFLKVRLFDPLGMSHTGFHAPTGEQSRVAVSYRRDGSGGLERVDGPLGMPPTSPPTFISGGGGLISTAGDYLRFAQMLANGGRLEGQRYLAPQTVELMTSQQVPDSAIGKAYGEHWRGLGFGLGVSPVIDFRAVPQANRNGDYTWPGVLDTNWMVSPSTGVVAVVLTQVWRGPDGRADRTYQDTPTFLIRNFGLTAGEAGILTGPMHLWGGSLATLFTAWLVARPSMIDPRRVVWLMGAVIGIATVVARFIHTSNSLQTIELLFWIFIPSIYFYIGPCFGLLNNLAEPRMRAMFCAFTLFFANVGNLIIAPQLVGVLSDHYVSNGMDNALSLRTAMLWLVPTGLWATFHYFWAAREILADQTRATGINALAEARVT